MPTGSIYSGASICFLISDLGAKEKKKKNSSNGQSTAGLERVWGVSFAVRLPRATARHRHGTSYSLAEKLRSTMTHGQRAGLLEETRRANRGKGKPGAKSEIACLRHPRRRRRRRPAVTLLILLHVWPLWQRKPVSPSCPC